MEVMLLLVALSHRKIATVFEPLKTKEAVTFWLLFLVLSLTLHLALRLVTNNIKFFGVSTYLILGLSVQMDGDLYVSLETRQYTAQRSQSTRFFSPVIQIGTHLSPTQQASVSPHWFQGGHTRLREKGYKGVPIQMRRQTLGYFVVHSVVNFYCRHGT